MYYSEERDTALSLNSIASSISRKGICSRATFFKYWEIFKPVSHIWAAFIHANELHDIRDKHQGPHIAFDLSRLEEWSLSSCPCDEPDLFWDSEAGQLIGDTFAWATEFRNFGINFPNIRSKGMLLNDSESWIIPELIPWPMEPLLDISKTLINWSIFVNG
jgi:hypothetical protein